MFSTLQPAPSDALLGMITAFRADPRPDKIDLGVGVYRDTSGSTPVMRAVRAAEQRLHDPQTTKAYLGIEGDRGFVTAVQRLALGDLDLEGRLIGLQTPGGCGALWLGARLIAAAAPSASVWTGTPTWGNHEPIFRSAHLAVEEYEFFDVAQQALRFDATIAALESAPAGDVVRLHGCCHNPTGAGFDLDQWRQLADLLVEKRLVPFIDLAYQGLGDGLDEEAAGLRIVLSQVEEAFVAYSCDKNFGMYRDRVGALLVLAKDARDADLAASNASTLARVSWSMPPDHGAAVVRTVLEDEDLTSLWRAELDEMRTNVQRNRDALARADPNLSFVQTQRGLFSTLPISPARVRAIRDRHAVYIADSGRINVAGMQPVDAATIVNALRAEGFVSSRPAT